MTTRVPARALQIFTPILDRLQLESAERFGFDGARMVPAGFEERPFSYLLRTAVVRAGVGPPALHVFIKVFKHDGPGAGVDMRARVLEDFAITCRVRAFMAAWPDLGAVRPVACYDDFLAIVTEQADGETLLELLKREAVWFPGAATVASLASNVEAVGRWLKHYQGFEPADGVVSLDKLRDYVDLRLRRLVEHRAIDEERRKRILAHLERLGRAVPSSALTEVAIHGDVAVGNILVHGSRVVMLDFAMAGRGSPLHDVSRLHMQLDLLRAKVQFRRRVIARLQQALLHGFDRSLTPRHPLFRLLSLLHRVNNFGTLALRKERFPVSLQNARLRAMHTRWIDAELSSPVDVP